MHASKELNDDGVRESLECITWFKLCSICLSLAVYVSAVLEMSFVYSYVPSDLGNQ